MLNHPDFAGGHHSTNWLENEVDLSGLTSEASPATATTAAAIDEAEPQTLTERTVPVEVDGKRFNVKVWLPDAPVVATRLRLARAATSGRRSRRPRASSGSGGDGTINAPMQGTIVKVLVNVGDMVEAGQALLVLEAMKMENQISSRVRRHGRRGPRRAPAASVSTGDVLVIIE